MSKSSEAKAKEILKTLTPEEADAIYRAVWVDRVIEDIKSYLDDSDRKAADNVIKLAAQIYVYDGEYDCNLSYWNNIANVIDTAQNILSAN